MENVSHYNNQAKPRTSSWFGASINKRLTPPSPSPVSGLTHARVSASAGRKKACFSSVFLDSQNFPSFQWASSKLHCTVPRPESFPCLSAALSVLPFELQTKCVPHAHQTNTTLQKAALGDTLSHLRACQIKHTEQDEIQVRSVINVFP